MGSKGVSMGTTEIPLQGGFFFTCLKISIPHGFQSLGGGVTPSITDGVLIICLQCIIKNLYV